MSIKVEKTEHPPIGTHYNITADEPTEIMLSTSPSEELLKKLAAVLPPEILSVVPELFSALHTGHEVPYLQMADGRTVYLDQNNSLDFTIRVAPILPIGQ